MTFEEFKDIWDNTDSHVAVRTSGSTGEPKIIQLSKEFMKESALRTNSFFNVKSSSRLHSCVSPDFIGGKMMAVRAEEAGCELTWETPSNRPELRDLENKTITLLAAVPSQMEAICRLDADKISKIENIIIGGAKINKALREKIEDSGLKAFETYGMTETASHIALRRVKKEEEWFLCLDGIKVYPDERGCIRIEFASGEKIITNDLGEFKNDREFKLKGRVDNIINTGGIKVNPIELERKIESIVDKPFIITAEEDEKWGNRPVLKIEDDQIYGKDEDEKLMKELKRILKPYEVPKRIVRVKEFKRTPNGKVMR